MEGSIFSEEELGRVQEAEALDKDHRLKLSFRGLTRTTIVGRAPDGSVISEEGLRVAEAMRRNQEKHRQARQEMGGEE